MKREQKWLHMMEDWDTQINKNFKKVMILIIVYFLALNLIIK